MEIQVDVKVEVDVDVEVKGEHVRRLQEVMLPLWPVSDPRTRVLKKPESKIPEVPLVRTRIRTRVGIWTRRVWA